MDNFRNFKGFPRTFQHFCFRHVISQKQHALRVSSGTCPGRFIAVFRDRCHCRLSIKRHRDFLIETPGSGVLTPLFKEKPVFKQKTALIFDPDLLDLVASGAQLSSVELIPACQVSGKRKDIIGMMSDQVWLRLIYISTLLKQPYIKLLLACTGRQDYPSVTCIPGAISVWDIVRRIFKEGAAGNLYRLKGLVIVSVAVETPRSVEYAA